MSDVAENLLIDLGNSRVKWGTSKNDDWFEGQPFENNGTQTDFSAWRDLKPASIYVSNSSGDSCYQTLCDWCLGIWSVFPQTLEAQIEQAGIKNGYRDPNQLGVDRWLAMIAARQIYSSAFVVVDCGTAVTVDSVSKNGQFLGGVISIGSGTMISALKAKAPHLSSGAMNYSGVLNLDTQNAIDSGAFIFVAGGIERALKEVESTLGSGFSVVMTGGSAPAIAPLIDWSVDVQPDLVLRGIQVVIATGS